MRDPYLRNVALVRVVDGDSVIVSVDLGYRLTTEQAIRLEGLDTPELASSDAEARDRARAAKMFAFDWFREHLHVETIRFPFSLRSTKGDKYGRWLGRIECVEGHCLNDALVTAGHAKPYAGGAR